jgi:hypothetical protein
VRSNVGLAATNSLAGGRHEHRGGIRRLCATRCKHLDVAGCGLTLGLPTPFGTAHLGVRSRDVALVPRGCSQPPYRGGTSRSPRATQHQEAADRRRDRRTEGVPPLCNCSGSHRACLGHRRVDVGDLGWDRPTLDASHSSREQCRDVTERQRPLSGRHGRVCGNGREVVGAADLDVDDPNLTTSLFAVRGGSAMTGAGNCRDLGGSMSMARRRARSGLSHHRILGARQGGGASTPCGGRFWGVDLSGCSRRARRP